MFTRPYLTSLSAFLLWHNLQNQCHDPNGSPPAKWKPLSVTENRKYSCVNLFHKRSESGGCASISVAGADWDKEEDRRFCPEAAHNLHICRVLTDLQGNVKNNDKGTGCPEAKWVLPAAVARRERWRGKTWGRGAGKSFWKLP